MCEMEDEASTFRRTRTHGCNWSSTEDAPDRIWFLRRAPPVRAPEADEGQSMARSLLLHHHRCGGRTDMSGKWGCKRRWFWSNSQEFPKVGTASSPTPAILGKGWWVFFPFQTKGLHSGRCVMKRAWGFDTCGAKSCFYFCGRRCLKGTDRWH
jgi:hypothetical protein